MPQNKPPDDGNHTVADGEWAGSISINYGYTDWKHDVWMRDENSQLRSTRSDPYQLAAGDILFVPPWEDKSADCATEQQHKFKLKAPTEIVRIRLLDPDNNPVKNANYTLQVEYDPGGGSYEQKNKQTDGSGMLTETIPSTATTGKLSISGLQQTINLKFGYLKPMDTSNQTLLYAAAQQRLLAIGFSPGAINGENNAATQGALKSFQSFCHDNAGKQPWVTDAGDADGTLSDKTQKALIKFYGA
jgi:hypothetical protein